MKKILIVDDEVDILDVMKLILTNNNFNVEAISKWQNIPQSIQSYKPDLILLDVSLGGADGREICNKLKGEKETAHIPVILCSAHHNLINNLNGCAPNAVIEKPFDSSDLVNIISNNLS